MPIGTGRRRPFLDYVLGALADAGCRHVCSSWRPSTTPSATATTPCGRRGSGSSSRSRTARRARRGRAGGRGRGRRRPFLVVNADNLYPVDAIRDSSISRAGLPAFDREALVVESNIPPTRRGFALLASTTTAGCAHRREARSAWLWPPRDRGAGQHEPVALRRRDLPACRDVARSARGECELPEAVGLALAAAARSGSRQPRRRARLSRRADVAAVERRLAAIELPRL